LSVMVISSLIAASPARLNRTVRLTLGLFARDGSARQYML